MACSQTNAPQTIHPELFMAARRGYIRQIRKLLNAEGTEATPQPNSTPPPPLDIAVEVDRPSLFVSRGSLLEGVTLEGDSVLHVVAACGDGDDFLECAMLIYDKARHLLDASNTKGETPLHRAAGAGRARMVSRLIALARGQDAGDAGATAMLRRRNARGETAMHDALRCSSDKEMLRRTVSVLLSADAELTRFAGNDGTSPLYLAISLGHDDIAEELHADDMDLSYSGPNGQNVLHAAVLRGKALPMLLEWCKHRPVQVQQGEQHTSVPLVSQLTNQQDRNGSTPLHLAASLEGWPSTKFLSRWFENHWPKSSNTVTLLLDANDSPAYQPDNKEWYPIHVSASNGSLRVVKILLGRSPDCATLRDGQGRTFVHVAVDKEKYSVVEYACTRPELSSILNAQDNNGDTALHLAVRVGNLAVFNRLIRCQQVHLNVPNKEGLTPIDLAWCELIPSRFNFGWNPRIAIWRSLALVGAPCGDSRPDHIYDKYDKKEDEKSLSENITNATQVMSIVSVLIATVTFAAAFTLPGGYRADDHTDGGTPTLAGSYSFNAFIISDTLAFICSSLATFSLVFAGMPVVDFSLRIRYFNTCGLLLQNSGRSLVAAFALGLYVVLAPVARNIAITVCVIIFASLLYGNLEVWQTICVANTARARFGINIPAARTYAQTLLEAVLIHFWSFIIIFGLPAIWKIHRTK